MSEVIIEAANLTKRYGDLTAVDDVSFQVAKEQIVGVLGPNGAGKTTLLEMIEGIREPDAGYAVVDGERTWPRNQKAIARIGVQLQATALFEGLRTREQLSTFAALHGVGQQRVDELLERVGLARKAKAWARDLSGGQQQRLAIAVALVHSPEVLFLDEPTAGLDALGRRELWEIVRDIRNDGTTVMLSTHYLEEAEALCDEVLILSEGHLIRQGRPGTLIRELDAPVHVIVDQGSLTEDDALLIPEVEAATSEHGSLTLLTREPATVIADLAERSQLRGLRVESARLEDAFLSITATGT